MLASDAFFPFADGPQHRARGRCRRRSSSRAARSATPEVLDAVREAGAAMVRHRPPPLPALTRRATRRRVERRSICHRQRARSPLDLWSRWCCYRSAVADTDGAPAPRPPRRRPVPPLPADALASTHPHSPVPSCRRACSPAMRTQTRPRRSAAVPLQSPFHVRPAEAAEAAARLTIAQRAVKIARKQLGVPYRGAAPRRPASTARGS